MSGTMAVPWTPSLGAWITNGGTAFRVWAPSAMRVRVVVERAAEAAAHDLARSADGTCFAVLPDVHAGDRYRYLLDDGRAVPDPASRFQPEGVHGPSEVVDPARFAWTDRGWAGLDPDDLVLYELHVGTFSRSGTFDGVAERLPDLVALGVTAVELMPVADFPGTRNWGYDGVALFAPARCYGSPDDLRRLVDAAHGLGLGVFVDVVYNHLGPDGAYLSAFSPDYFTDRHATPWGAAVNFDGPGSEKVREFFIENARHWVHEYHVDGLRLDATHAMVDESRRHFLAELAARVRESVGDRRVLLIAEDHRNLNWMAKPDADGGWGLDAVWADDFHHQCRVLLAGDSEGYYRDFTGRAADLAATIRRGWFYTGQRSTHFGHPRGTDPSGLAPARFVICLQNHDQVGNRARGERLHHQIDLASYRAASALLLLAPETPLLFMGQEWAASSPFLYFTDHEPALGRLVTAGRRDEFRHFAAFSDPSARELTPDPQALATFEASRLSWNERDAETHAATLRLYRALLEIRRRDLQPRSAASFRVEALDEGTIAMSRTGSGGTILTIARLKGAGPVELTDALDGPADRQRSRAWRVLLTTEDAAFSPDPAPPRLAAPATVQFLRPSAIILTA
jgi:maltooligosyltrehalose trehalohydrolase